MSIQMDQHEIKTPGPLLDRRGHLREIGWSPQPLLDCNLEDVSLYWIKSLQRFRIKRWDYYGVTTPERYFSVTLADLGYAGQVFVYLVDFEQRTHFEETITLPFARGIVLPRGSSRGLSRFDGERVKVVFQAESGGRHVQLQWPTFKGGGISADLHMHCAAEHESMVIVIPFALNRFYYNRKINCMPAEGSIVLGEEKIHLKPDACLGNFDWGRGIWPYASFWVWASASGFLPDRRTVGLNLGFGFGDTSRATENAVVLEGRIHKLSQVDFSYQPADTSEPWEMRSRDGRLQLSFHPFVERVAKTNLLLIASEVHQMFGQYSGWFVTDDGERIEIQGLVGFAEEHHARW
jgi:hypothetical protein